MLCCARCIISAILYKVSNYRYVIQDVLLVLCSTMCMTSAMLYNVYD